MNSPKNENTILNIIKYGPILVVLIVSFIITQIVLLDKNENYEHEVKLLQETFLDKNKQRIKEEIDEVYTFIQNEKNKSEKLLKTEIKSKVYESHQIATNIFIEESKIDKEGHKHSNEHIFQTIKNALAGIIYNNGRGYIFMDDINGTKLLQPLNKEFEGRNLLEFEDAKGYKFVKKIVETIKNKSESFDSYYWYKSQNKEDTYKKISFYKYFEPLNIAIGTGEYIDDFQNELKKRVLEKIRNIRYGNNGYIFIYDQEGNCLSHYNKDLIGKNRIKYKDKNNRLLVKEIIDFTKKEKEGFLSYTSSINPINNSTSTSKLSYLKLFEEWGWVIGTGFYLDILEEEILRKKEQLIKSNQDAIEQIIYASILITLIFILISFLISKYINSIFNKYKIDLKKEIDTTIEQEKLLIQQSKMATMGEMIGNIAHQWKQPLSLISMSNSLIHLNQENKDFYTKNEIDGAIGNIDNSVRNLSETIDDFRNFFKPEKEKSYFKVEELFNKTHKLITSQFKSNDIEMFKKIEDTELFGYPNELLQVLINILKNAKDELVTTERYKRRLLFIEIYKKDAIVIIKIKDNAGGIPENILNKIFDAYFTTKEDKEGTGIGLYMSKQIIENMNGKIEVSNTSYEYENEKYSGAEFSINIPL